MMNTGMSRLAILALASGLLPALVSCGDEKGAAGHGHAPAAVPDRGPHGGRLLSEGAFQIEVTIFERGVPPEFRVYVSEAGKPADLEAVKLDIAVHRLGERVDVVGFRREGDFLRGDKTVYEPHSFEVKLAAEYGGKSYRLGYSQVEARTELSPEAAKASGVVVETSGPATMKRVLELSGEIVLDPDRVARVVPRFDAVVTEVRKSLGDRVSRGEVLAVIESRELTASRLRYVRAVHKQEFAQASFLREEQLWKKKITAEEEYLLKRHMLEEARDEVSAAGQELRAMGIGAAEVQDLAERHEGNFARYELRAPLDGVVIGKNVTLGEAVKDDTEIFEIADLGTVLAKVTVHAGDLNAVRVGQDLVLRSEALGAEAPGKVAYLGPLIGKETRTAQVHVRVPNPEGLWRPGLFVGVRLVQEEFTVPVAVRADAIQKFRDWDVVFIQDGNLFEAVALEPGRREGGWVEVLSGLPAGRKYVAKNSFLIKADILKSGATHDH